MPASLVQLANFISVLKGSLPPYSGRYNVSADYLQLFNIVFCIQFGLLAIWWSHIRELKRDQPVGTQPSGKSAQDMSLMDWALGSIEPERNVTLSEKQSAATSGSQQVAEDAQE